MKMDNMSNIPEVNIVEHANIPNAWVVEHIDADGDGGVAVTIFDSCDAKGRAEAYADWLRATH
jgi:hypothetical protein